VEDRRFKHFKPSHSRLQNNTALKFAPETGRLVDAIGMKNWHFRGHREPVFHSVFIQFSFSFLSPDWKLLKVNNLEVVAGGGFEPPTFGL
jgi:hypothetical protein